ncbi:Uncharacterised protein [Mycobacteroides abscessus subsp. abscessus]|uniref:hypothetical protein n=1 Tax=Mycobacteroides abscessus TaxID=36809 RepID=UPI000927BDF3|nr:hypothetical protein [Mycobacteroides abscessus]SIC07067.1 Uncharacterised protein [Mycobacteroides abscessus subsp. abscessus]
MGYVVQSDITYRTGQRSITYWSGGALWTHHASEALQFDTESQAKAEFGLTPLREKAGLHKYTVVVFNELVGVVEVR